jgi:hypothetical protein
VSSSPKPIISLEELVLKARLIDKQKPGFLLDCLMHTSWTEATTFTVEEWLVLIVAAYESRNAKTTSHVDIQA